MLMIFLSLAENACGVALSRAIPASAHYAHQGPGLEPAFGRAAGPIWWVGIASPGVVWLFAADGSAGSVLLPVAARYVIALAPRATIKATIIHMTQAFRGCCASVGFGEKLNP
jgi:hypothetical protein